MSRMPTLHRAPYNCHPYRIILLLLSLSAGFAAAAPPTDTGTTTADSATVAAESGDMTSADEAQSDPAISPEAVGDTASASSDSPSLSANSMSAGAALPDTVAISLESLPALVQRLAPELDARRFLVLAAEAEAGERLSYSRPQVTAVASVDQRWREYGEDEAVGRYAVIANQILYDAGVRGSHHEYNDARIAQAEASLRLGMHQLTLTGSDLLWRILAESQRVTIWEERLQDRKAELADARRSRDAGRTGELDVHQARIARTQAERSLTVHRRNRIDRLRDLALILDVEAEDIVLVEPWRRLADSASIISEAEIESERHAAVRFHHLEADALRADGDVKGRAGLPTLSAFASAGNSRLTSDEAGEEEYVVGLQLSWHILDGGARHYGRMRQRHLAAAADRRAGLVARQTHHRIQSLRSRLMRLGEEIASQRDAQRRADQAYSMTRRLYGEGLVAYARVNDLNALTHEARLDLIRLIEEENILLAELAILQELCEPPQDAAAESPEVLDADNAADSATAAPASTDSPTAVPAADSPSGTVDGDSDTPSAAVGTTDGDSSDTAQNSSADSATLATPPPAAATDSPTSMPAEDTATTP